MATSTTRLTNTQIKNQKPGPKDTVLSEDVLEIAIRARHVSNIVES